MCLFNLVYSEFTMHKVLWSFHLKLRLVGNEKPFRLKLLPSVGSLNTIAMVKQTDGHYLTM